MKLDLRDLARRRLLVVTGKGGVGKSTFAASLGLVLARAGRRVLLLEIDPRESLYQLLDVPPSGGEIVRVVTDLFVQNLQPRTVIDQIVREQLRLRPLARRVLASPVYHQFAEGAPGLKEVAVIAHARRVVRGQAGKDASGVDLVILDAPATGHGLSLLAAPQLVAEVIRDGPVGHMGAKLAAFVSDAERCGVIVVTMAEEMPVQEAIELVRSLDERMSRAPDLVVVNGLYPALEPAATGGEAAGDPLRVLWTDRRSVNERELRRLEQVWNGPRVDLPLLPFDRGPELISALEEPLARQLLGVS